MRSRAEISEEAVRLAAQYSTDLEHTRYALSRAELFQLGSFWHGDRLKTESQLRAELEGTGLLESLAWVLKPSLAHALSLKDLDPGMVVRLFEIPEPWSVRQQRMLLLGFVPFSDLPFYTWDELARSLRSFHGFLLAQHDALVGTGLPETPFYESVWLHATAGPLYPNSALSPWTSPQFREKVLAAKTDIVGLLADGVRDVAGRAGGRSSCKAASDLWNRCCARLCALFADQDSSLRFRKELAQVNAASHATVEESSIGWGALAGSVTALMVVAMHCCKELSVGTFHKTRGLLGELVKPGSGDALLWFRRRFQSGLATRPSLTRRRSWTESAPWN